MTFSESIQTCLRDKYATFSGRASRSEFWWFFFANILFWLVMGLVGSVFFGGGYFEYSLGGETTSFGTPEINNPIWGIINLILYLGLLIPSISVAVRRVHDRGLSGWWYGALYILMIGMFFIPLLGLLVFVWGIGLLVLFIMKGTQGPNKFGPDPLGGGEAEIFS